MANQYVNKVVLNGVTRLDLSGDTVTAASLLKGYTAHNKAGAAITGTLEAGGGSAELAQGTVSLLDTNVLVGDVDFEALIADNREFFLFVEDMDFMERTTGEVLFGHYENECLYLQYYEGNDILNVTQVDISEITASSTTLGISIAETYFANCNYTVVYAEYSAIPTTITAGDTPMIVNNSTVSADRATAEESTGLTISITKAGTYRIKAAVTNPYSASTAFSYKALARVYVNGTAKGTLQTISAYTTIILSEDLSLSAGDTVEIYASSAGASAKVSVSCLQACIDWNNGF